MNFDINKLLRDNIRLLKPYSSARDEFSGEAVAFLDANENPFNSPWNRYPDPRQIKLKTRVGEIKNIAVSKIFLGNGSDEPIDLLFRAFCEPGKDNIVSINPTYGMYRVAADTNNVAVNLVPLSAEFELDADAVLNAVTGNTKLIFLCSPNNPSGNALDNHAMLEIVENFSGIVVVDEAYIDFCPEKSFLPMLDKYPNLVILQTFSKAWGMAGLRLGMAFASEPIIDVLSRIKYPYNLSILTQQKGLELLANEQQKLDWVAIILKERDKMIENLKQYPFVIKVFPTDANFVLVKTHDPRGIYQYLVDEKIIVRDRSSISLCEGCLRISIGSPEENATLIEAFDELI
ncbi:MAG TPA: histidinol-phosphate transaminase [Prolixibacteraceae bacterium]|nr:histidinol-phosphate transaminase [Prolixibacteraceae bacterium]